METLALRGLSFTYPGQGRPALDRVTLTVTAGDFFVLCGPSGCGKSTLLRQLKTDLTPHGARTGDILLDGKPLEDHDRRYQARSIGFVHQSPDNQIVTDKVWHELAFGPESLGWDGPTIRRRVAEMASFFGIQNWFHRDVSSLSGGQKQLLNLAAVMVLGPDLLLLDEPTSQLDPIAAADFLGALGRLNRELGTTVLLTEHRLEEALPLANRAAVMDRGTILTQGSPREVGRALVEGGHPMLLAMPTPLRVAAAVDGSQEPPLTVREGRDWLGRFAAAHPLRPLPDAPGRTYPAGTAVSCRDVWFRYEKDGPDVVKGLSLELKRGEVLALLGGNGTGKTTLLKLLTGPERPHRGAVAVHGSVGVLPQDPRTLFVKKTVREDLLDLCGDEARVAYAAALCRLDGLLDRHPFDLSGGEQQRAALAKVLLLEPDILLLDEPTKGLDARFKQTLARILNGLPGRGISVLMVSHDMEFCAAHAHRCALMFDGGIVTQGPPRDFFSGNSFYTTAADRMGRALAPGAVTADDLIAVCGGEPAPPPPLPDDPPPPPKPGPGAPDPAPPAAGLPRWRKVLALLSGGVALALLGQFMGLVDLSPLLAALGIANRAARQLWLNGLFCAAALTCAFAAARRRARPGDAPPPPSRRRRLPRRTVLGAAFALLLVPATLLAGQFFPGERNYYLTMLLVLLECMLPFLLVFEGRKPRPRELVVVAVLCAVGVVGRSALVMLPQFKPAVALVIVSGAALGGETGFLVGAVTMLASNVLLGQGPYTPWQMFAAGIIGFLAGTLCRAGLLRRSRLPLCIFGALSTLVLYGGIMNLQSALQASPTALTPGVFLAYEAAGFPMDCVHAAATWFFLWVAAEPLLEKLDRVKAKYGLAQ